MAGFTGQDDLINQVTTNGKFWRADWNKNWATAGTTVTGTWYCLAGGAGNPPANTAFGSGVTSVFKPMYDISTNGGGIWHGGFVDSTAATGYKTIMNGSAYSAAPTTMPNIFMLVDLLGYYTMTNATISTTGTKTLVNSENVTFSSSSGLLMTTANDWADYTPCRFTNSGGALPTGLSAGTTYWTVRVSATTSRLATSLVNAIAGTVISYTDSGSGTNTFTIRLPRYGDGAGVQSIMAVSTAGTAGAATFQYTYTNAAGTVSRLTPSSPALPTNTAVSPLLNIPYSGTGSGKYGPFMPLQGADTGIQSIQNLIIAAAGVTTGVYNICYVKPLLTIPMTTLGVAGEREFISQLPSMPRVYDGACLVWLSYAQSAVPTNSAFYGHLDFGWS